MAVTLTKILTFEVESKVFAIRADDVIEVVRAVAMTSTSDHDQIDGIFNLRGQLVPLIDLRAKFSLPKKPIEKSDHFIVARLLNEESKPQTVAFRVDRSLDLTEVLVAELPNIVQRDFAAVVKIDDNIVLIYDLHKLIAGMDFSAIFA